MICSALPPDGGVSRAKWLIILNGLGLEADGEEGVKS